MPIESQVAVFAKDSLQAPRISFTNPRTLFFNDEVAVGWVRGGVVELAAHDPKYGATFYLLDPMASSQPTFVRHDECLSCHYSYSTAGVPGMLMRSAGQFAADHSTPLENRWGGWYVTGTHGAIRHLGNVDPEKVFDSPVSTASLNWPSFAGKFDTSGYLTAHSDIVALMVFEHQMHMMNLLSRIGWESRVAAAGGSDDPVPVADAAREVVDYLLFVDEAPLTDAVQGSSGFTEVFTSLGPRDRQGRSLRQFDLRRRMMRYPCSYMIYSRVFNELPLAAKEAIYRRMWQILSGAEKDGRYARLSLEDRRAIIEILRDTKDDLPPYWIS